jgi:hypothetical protein
MNKASLHMHGHFDEETITSVAAAFFLLQNGDGVLCYADGKDTIIARDHSWRISR